MNCLSNCEKKCYIIHIDMIDPTTRFLHKMWDEIIFHRHIYDENCNHLKLRQVPAHDESFNI